MSKKRYDAFEERLDDASEEELAEMFEDALDAANSGGSDDRVFLLADVGPKGEFRWGPQVVSPPEDDEPVGVAYRYCDLEVEVPVVDATSPTGSPALVDVSPEDVEQMGWNELRELASEVEGVPAGGEGVDSDFLQSELAERAAAASAGSGNEVSVDDVRERVREELESRRAEAIGYGN